MFAILDFTSLSPDAALLRRKLPRARVDVDAALESVRPLMEEVRERGAVALRNQAQRFDGVRPRHLRVPAAALAQALEQLDPQLRQAIELSIEHNRRGHEAQLPQGTRSEIIPGGVVEQRWIPVERVGLYVPGGLAVYPSSVVMNVVPAQVAGVESIALASPAQAAFDGLPHPTVLATCALLGVSEVYAMGGAGAIAAFAYGAKGESDEDGEVLVEAVDVVTGPGNIYVAAAKQAVASVCGIDAVAGTTEIAVVADDSAQPAFVAADLISQAEHDPAAASVLITDSAELIEAVQRELEIQIPQRDHRERIFTALSGPHSGAILVRDLDQGVEVANAYGAEHLEIQTRDAQAVAARIHNAGGLSGGFQPCLAHWRHRPLQLGFECACLFEVGTADYLFSPGRPGTHRPATDLRPGRGPGGTRRGAGAAQRHPRHHPGGGLVKGTENRENARLTLPLRADLAGMEPYGAPQLQVPVTINVNENPYPVPAAVREAITAAVGQVTAGLNRYPDREFPQLRAALAEYLHQESGVALDPKWIWAANGSNEVMAHIFQAFGGPGHAAISAVPTYSMYPEYARNAFSELIEVPRREDFTVDVEALSRQMRLTRPAIVLLASPNNPTGTHLPSADIRQILEVARESGPQDCATLVVIDEAYAEFRRDGVPSALELVEPHPHLVVSRTMSKAFAMAGLRLGYAAAHPQVIDKLRLVRLPYHLSALTQAAAVAALGKAHELQAQVVKLRHTRDQMVRRLEELGLEVAPSDTNFVLFGRFEDRHAVWEALLERGVLIREVGPQGWLRASVGTEEETRVFLEALQEVLKHD